MALRAKWQAADIKAKAFRNALTSKYGHFDLYAPRGKREQYARYTAAADKIADKFFALLDSISPRNWRSGVPWYWILEHLTYADAITPDQLAVVPPCAYGLTPQDMIHFAWPVRREHVVGYASSETAYGRTVNYDFAVKVF